MIEIILNNIIEIISRDFFYITMKAKTKPWRYIPQHRDSKTKKPRHRDSGSKTPWHPETIKPRHHLKAFFQRTKSHHIGIPRLKNHDIDCLDYKFKIFKHTSGVHTARLFKCLTIFIMHEIVQSNYKYVHNHLQ